MSDGSKIEWLHDGVKKALTWNPTTGCTKVSAGCKHCYAKREWVRLSANPRSIYYGRKFEDVAMHPQRLMVPLLLTKPRRIFVDSMSDLFHDDVKELFIVAVLGVAAISSHHTFIILSKRAERMRLVLSYRNQGARSWMVSALLHYGLVGYIDKLPETITWPLPNVQLGVSVESREHLDRVDALRATPAAVRVISAEPLLEDLGGFNLQDIHQVYAGGETGPKSRPSHPDWFRSLRDECSRQGVAFFFKQWGDWSPAYAWARAVNVDPATGAVDDPNSRMGKKGLPVQGVNSMFRVGKKNAGRTLDGKLHNELVA
jgi:protein gp37